jgi:phospholipase C
MDRRDFIRTLGLAGTSAAAYAACSNYMSEALAQSTVIEDLLSSAAHCKLGSLKDIEHVIFLMQENRSFDHYYGTLRGVRGFGDPRPLRLKNGKPVFEQTKVSPIALAAYTINRTDWSTIDNLVKENGPKAKRLLKDKIKEVLPNYSEWFASKIDALEDDFFLRFSRGEWNTILPEKLRGKPIPDMLKIIKSNPTVITGPAIDPKLADLLATELRKALNNEAVARFIKEQLKKRPVKLVDLGIFSIYLDFDMMKFGSDILSNQTLVSIVLPMLTSAIDTKDVEAFWPQAVTVLPSLAHGLPTPQELFELVKDFARQVEDSRLADMVDLLPNDADTLAKMLNFEESILQFLTPEIKAQYPQIAAWLKNKGPIKPFQARRGTESAGDYKSFGLAHGYKDGLGAVARGWNDDWLAAKNNNVLAMAHLEAAKDLSYYSKLIEAFTICDGYHCSVPAGTDPNRSHFWSGTAKGLPVNTYFTGSKGSVVKPDWKTYPEHLQDLKIDWKFYQNGINDLGVNQGEFTGDFEDNTVIYFKQYWNDQTNEIFRRCASPNTILRTDPDEPSDFEKDVASGTLPAVSWIVAPTAFSEHPSSISPHFGEYYTNEILKVLAAHPEVWKKTVFILNYDENDGFFDHVPPPMPPLPGVKDIGKVSQGISIPQTADVKNVDAECVVRDADGNWKAVADQSQPMGLGTRVPCVIVSPWTVGGRVCSELFDHTSTLRFLDAWLAAKGLHAKDTEFKNISSWRRAICGDLTSAFDFTRQLDKVAEDSKIKLGAAVAASKSVPPYLTAAQQKALKAALPQYSGAGSDIAIDNAEETRHKQAKGQVDLLPLGYDFNVYASVTMTDGKVDKFKLTFQNKGSIGVALNVYSYHAKDKDRGAWFYALTKAVKADAPVEVVDAYDLMLRGGTYEFAVHGPNGYLSELKGDANNANQKLIADIVEVKSDSDAAKVRFDFGKWPGANGGLTMINAYTGESVSIAAGTNSVTSATKDGWYDVAFIDKAGQGYLRRYAGHLENGKISKSDPAIGMTYDAKKRVYVSLST